MSEPLSLDSHIDQAIDDFEYERKHKWDDPEAGAKINRLADRIAELSTGRIEARLARFFLKLADNMGQPTPDGTVVALALSRQELADMIGTTIETAIRVMSRWGKEGVVRTEKDGFVIADRPALEAIALT